MVVFSELKHTQPS